VGLLCKQAVGSSINRLIHVTIQLQATRGGDVKKKDAAGMGKLVYRDLKNVHKSEKKFLPLSGVECHKNYGHCGEEKTCEKNLTISLRFVKRLFNIVLGSLNGKHAYLT
jgi:hypothetical protein